MDIAVHASMFIHFLTFNSVRRILAYGVIFSMNTNVVKKEIMIEISKEKMIKHHKTRLSQTLKYSAVLTEHF